MRADVGGDGERYVASIGIAADRDGFRSMVLACYGRTLALHFCVVFIREMRNLRIVAMLMFLWVAPAFGQGCAMCKANAAAAPASTQRALRRGILTLLLPSLGMVLVLGGLVVKYRD